MKMNQSLPKLMGHMKLVLRAKFIALCAYIKKWDIMLVTQLKALEQKKEE